ncbi:MAG: hypothetical protein FWG64_02915 [Firmicutes bacterium]|nr:hypothetical protein [Bacillota bacterium]
MDGGRNSEEVTLATLAEYLEQQVRDANGDDVEWIAAAPGTPATPNPDSQIGEPGELDFADLTLEDVMLDQNRVPIQLIKYPF